MEIIGKELSEEEFRQIGLSAENWEPVPTMSFEREPPGSQIQKSSEKVFLNSFADLGVIETFAVVLYTDKVRQIFPS